MFKKSYKKSQAALEFLTTYAWAFLVIIIMMAALAYFGILSPAKLLPERCSFGAEIGCDRKMMKIDVSDTGPTMTLSNNFGTSVTIAEVRVINSDTGIECSVSLPADGTLWPIDGMIIVAGTGCGALVENEKMKFSVEIDYYSVRAGATYTKVIFGEIYSSVTA